MQGELLQPEQDIQALEEGVECPSGVQEGQENFEGLLRGMIF